MPSDQPTTHLFASDERYALWERLAAEGAAKDASIPGAAHGWVLSQLPAAQPNVAWVLPRIARVPRLVVVPLDPVRERPRTVRLHTSRRTRELWRRLCTLERQFDPEAPASLSDWILAHLPVPEHVLDARTASGSSDP